MDVSLKKVGNDIDFWSELAPTTKERIGKRLSDSENGRYSLAKSFLQNILEK